jgi:molybdopterin converting factor subunit 1
MRCHVLLFAQLRESLGTPRLELDLPDGSTVGDGLDRLAQEHEVISDMRGRIAVAVDAKYQPMSAQLTDGCELALIPPVSGG